MTALSTTEVEILIAEMIAAGCTRTLCRDAIDALRALCVERDTLRAQLASARNEALKQVVAICAEREIDTLSKQGQAVARLIGKAIRSLMTAELAEKAAPACAERLARLYSFLDEEGWHVHANTVALAEETIATLTAQSEAARAEAERLREALMKMVLAVCGPTGFAAAVRNHSGLAYPWEALEIAEAEARAALAAREG